MWRTWRYGWPGRRDLQRGGYRHRKGGTERRAGSRKPYFCACACACFAASVSMMWCTPSGSSTTFVPSHRALLVNSEQSSLMSTS